MVAKVGASVMVVEDQSVIATWLQLRLERLGYAVLDSASDAEDAVAKAQALNPDVILMDVHLGGGSDGVLAAQQIRERYGIPVVLVTRSVDDHTLRRAREARLDGFIQKPFDERQLHTAIQTALCKRRLEVERNTTPRTRPRPPPVEWPLRAMLHRLNNELAVATALLELLQEDQRISGGQSAADAQSAGAPSRGGTAHGASSASHEGAGAPEAATSPGAPTPPVGPHPWTRPWRWPRPRRWLSGGSASPEQAPLLCAAQRVLDGQRAEGQAAGQRQAGLIAHAVLGHGAGVPGAVEAGDRVAADVDDARVRVGRQAAGDARAGD